MWPYYTGTSYTGATIKAIKQIFPHFQAFLSLSNVGLPYRLTNGHGERCKFACGSRNPGRQRFRLFLIQICAQKPRGFCQIRYQALRCLMVIPYFYQSQRTCDATMSHMEAPASICSILKCLRIQHIDNRRFISCSFFLNDGLEPFILRNSFIE